MATWSMRTFERYAFHRLYARQARRLAADGDWPPAFAALASSLDTPIRLAGFMEETLREQGELRLFDVPKPAVVTWREGGGHAADWARFAQEVLVRHGYQAVYLTLTKASPLLLQVVSAVYDPASQGWFHLSNLGLFGLYGDWDELSDDLLPDWEHRFVRDDAMRLVEEVRATAGNRGGRV